MTSKTAYTRQNTYDEMHASKKSSDKKFQKKLPGCYKSCIP